MSIDIDNDLLTPRRVQPIPWDTFADALMRDYARGLVASQTHRAMRDVLDRIGELEALDGDGHPIVTPHGRMAAVQTTADLSIAVIGRLVEARSREVSPATVRAMLSFAAVVCTRAVHAGGLAISPFKRRPIGSWVRKEPPQGKRYLTREEIRDLLNLMQADVDGEARGWRQWKSRRLLAAFALAIWTGLRAGELFHLHMVDIDVERRLIHVRPRGARKLKTAQSAGTIPLAARLVPYLTEWYRHRLDCPRDFRLPPEVPWVLPGNKRRSPWVGGGPGVSSLDQLQDSARRAGIRGGATWQMCRRSLTTHMRRFGPGSLAAQMLRHSERVDNEWYAVPDVEDMREVLDRVEF